MGDATILRLLVVDADEDAAVLAGTLLESAAPTGTTFVVRHASSLAAAAARLTEEPAPDAVLLDLGLPDLVGGAPVAGIAAVSSIPDAPPVVAMATTARTGREAVTAGASDYITPEELVEHGRLWRAVILAIERHRHAGERTRRGPEVAVATTPLARLSSRLQHDLRSPLAVAISALETIQNADLADAARDGLLALVGARLHDLARRLDDLASDLAVGDADEEPTRAEVELAALADAVCDDLAGPERGRLALEVTGAERLWAPPHLLQALLGGLVRNALQHNPDRNVTMHVEARLEDRRAVIVVADDGVGIPVAVREAVFDVGWTTGEEQGSRGVGLAAARSAIAVMEGTIRAIDSPYGGAAFRIELPQRPPPTAAG